MKFQLSHISLDVNISPRDPRWIGAWWIGFLAFGIGSILSAFPVMLFPRRLGKIKSKKNADGVQKSQTPMRKFMLGSYDIKWMIEI